MNKLTLFLGGVALGACGYGLKKWYDKQCQKEQGDCDENLGNFFENTTKDEENFSEESLNKEKLNEKRLNNNSERIIDLFYLLDKYSKPFLQDLKDKEFLNFKAKYTDDVSYDLKNINLEFKDDLEEIIRRAKNLKALEAFYEIKNKYTSFIYALNREIHRRISKILAKQK
ncbi:hypothetical protein [Campylobacter sp. US33a]|uniref:Lipoprotein n=1 Tax=Campylobacter sp. CCS1377 TaxID=3158229 RepID=A0AAU7E6I4_9BACT|nr:hypothetical protein [Campylobacter sp. US33a]MCW1360174.1 hypothetical protein [Campylobacter jejuni]TEY03896.1 hypothetical protein ELQ16_01235 [Campylobacter sp. US33a]